MSIQDNEFHGEPITQGMATPKPFYQPLFDLMVNEHGLHLLDSEMDEIMDVCRRLDGRMTNPSPVTENPQEDAFYEKCEAEIKGEKT